jgi:hypothetical protein
MKIAVHEPANYAMIISLLALGLAVRPRRKTNSKWHFGGNINSRQLRWLFLVFIFEIL